MPKDIIQEYLGLFIEPNFDNIQKFFDDIVKNEIKKLLVTGGAGFVGSHLCEELAKDSNNHVVSLDCYFSGSKKNHKKC